jgi:hypothetical protein
MNRHLRYSLGPTLLAVGMLAGSAWPAAAVTRAMTSLEVRAQFSECGYEIGNPGSPGNPNNPYIVLRDPGASQMRNADYRIVMAIVYRDIETANAAHTRAHHQAEQLAGEQHPFSNDNGPQLLTGYGGSVWRANVALVESTSRTLASMYSYDVEADETREARPDLLELGFVSTSNQYAVDRDFVSCLEDAPAFIASTSDGATPATVEPVQPIFLQGRPW